jgi:3-hydroxybutyryl-CoA dehydrogenase
MALKVAVIGAGTMGNGIAQVFAQAGHAVVLSDVDGSALERARAQIDRSLGKLAEKGKIAAADRTAALERIEFTRDLADVTAADLVVEAVVEKFDVKRELFAELDRITKPGTILASNTSSISITRLGAVTKRADKVVGMHFMNPVPLMALVEVIRGQATSDETTRTVMDLSRALG